MRRRALPALNPVPAASDVGDKTPNDGLSRSCSSSNSAAACANGLARLVNGGLAGGRWPGLNSFNRGIGLGNVVVTYERSGLGYKGRPRGAVVTISLETPDGGKAADA